jgi:Spy/CpxP family protein refolding chaperone
MNRLHLFAAGTMLMFALSTGAQQTATSPDTHAVAAAPVEQHLKLLSEKLALTADQQDKTRPILQEMHDGSQKINDDQTLTPDQRHAAMGELFMKSDKQMREFLTDDQKKKLDEMEAQMHGGPHDHPDTTSPAPPQK